MIHFLLVVFALTFTVQPPTYFEGAFTLYRYKPDNKGGKTGERILQVEMSRQRIRLYAIGGSEPSGIFKEVGATDLIIRHDKQDFVFLTNEKTAIVMSKEEIQAISTLIAMARKQDSQNALNFFTVPNLEWTETTTTKTILGYPTIVWTAKVEDEARGAKLWISDRFRIFWGMLSEPWVADAGISGILPIQDVFRDGQTPLRVETIHNGSTFEVIEFTDIKKAAASTLNLDIPAGYRVLTFQDLIRQRAQDAN